MKTLKIGVILLALLLAAMAMVPMVNAAKTSDKNSNDMRSLIESNYIPDDIAKEHATITMLKMIQSGALNESWIGAKINPDYQIIYDINGEKLFYQFSVE